MMMTRCVAEIANRERKAGERREWPSAIAGMHKENADVT
jgi:hypothetical protein